jgi:hypothetical protein
MKIIGLKSKIQVATLFISLNSQPISCNQFACPPKSPADSSAYKQLLSREEAERQEQQLVRQLTNFECLSEEDEKEKEKEGASMVKLQQQL